MEENNIENLVRTAPFIDKTLKEECSDYLKKQVPKKVKEGFLIGASTIASCYDDEDLKYIMTILYKGPSAMWPSNLVIQETPEGTYTCQKIQVVGDLVERGKKEYER